jgi:hypothetical protein
VQCEFRLFRRSVFRRIPIQSDGPFVFVEVLAKANFLTAIMSEVPVGYQSVARPASWWKEAWRVFAHPDFGPAVLPPEPPTSEPGSISPAPTTAELPADCGLLHPVTDVAASNGDPNSAHPQPAPKLE